MSPTLHERIGKALGWPLKDVQSMSLTALRELLRPEHPDLVYEIGKVVEEGSHLTVDRMKDQIHRMAKDLGMPPIKFDPDADLHNFVRGKPLLVGELRALPAKSVVYVWYKEHGEDGPRIDQAMRISKYDESDPANANTWGLEDGSSFGADFTPTGDFASKTGEFATPPDTAACFDEGCGEGEMYLFHAVPVPPTPKKAKKARKRR